MAGLIRTILLKDIGNWWHTLDVERKAKKLERQINAQKTDERNQALSVYALELTLGGLIDALRDKKILSDEEIHHLMTSAEKKSQELVARSHPLPTPKLRR